MSANSNEEDNLPSRTSEEADTPRKKMRQESSTRKSWSLMDRKTDLEVLQEMGVSLLEPDDGDQCDVSMALHHKPGTKRKHNDIENVSPNVNLVTSPQVKSPRGTLKMCSPNPGPSQLKSPGPRAKTPRTADKLSKPLQPTSSEQHLLETTITSEPLVDEETPIAQIYDYSLFTETVARTDLESSPMNRIKKICSNEFISTSGTEQDQSSICSGAESRGADSFAALSDEMLLSVFRWLPKLTLAHCMLVCKRWHRVALDETLWQRLDLGFKILSKNALGKILARKPVIVRLANSEIGEWHPTSPEPPSRIQYLDLSMTLVDTATLTHLLLRCPTLNKLSLESVKVDDTVTSAISKCSNLETLNLAMAEGITAEGLKELLEGCTKLQSLNISWCHLTEEALEVLVTSLPARLQRLNVAGARIMTDEMVTKLVARCSRLLELDLSDCSALHTAAVLSVLTLTRLEHLALSRCYLLPPHVLTKLSSMASLQYLEVWGMLQTASLNALRAALPAIQINQFMFSAIARPTVGTRRTSIWGLRTRD